MKVLVVGGGGREHALVWKLKQSPRVKEIFCAPGNAGIASLARCVPIGAEDISGLVAFARQEKIDLTVVGPEGPLTMGIVDSFNEAGLAIFGPNARAAAIEGSKVLAKELMAKYGIPTARFATFSDAGEAVAYIRQLNAPCVVKADGLAAGKGVVVCRTVEEALEAVGDIMVKGVFGAAGSRVVVEEYLTGQEVSILAFTDGKTVIPMLPAQDHKQVYDGDQGPNTGGMGAYAPAPVCTPEVYQTALEKILIPTVRAMAAEGRPYRGVLYAGLMVTDEGAKVLEFNARFGDPEAQPVLMLLETDLVEIIEAVLSGRLAEKEIRWRPGAAVCVVLASAGYPGPYRKGYPISGLDRVPPDVMVFHAGTALEDGRVVTAGGRVLGVTAAAGTIAAAIEKAYAAVEQIHFEGMHYRRDIGRKALSASKIR
ncbi:phosphoribosylamine--glycine ligase [Desulfofundulus thermosubterraneus]|uniref:Phosphoribosylamine--glycine ligase n=1 Tax=Desulfofundulus thermosubterraneus DSM 16057 TaxID=1121432 RepID=A0A1M6IV04_9FIRM|nr:phosphoribosylamine--glycine ligase [Desulfofundulus thermosubterraneus]SHJ38293.1 phosphoribosylamine--glycine ligase [Desulfofundulus thermosubterraneus DSM 16057]